MNAMFLRRKRKIYVKPGDAQTSPQYVATLQKNIEPLGYAFSPELIDALRTLDLDRLKRFEKELHRDLREMLGAKRTWRVLYPNFPQQVMELDEAELYLNAVRHYFTPSELPETEVQPRSPFDEPVEPRKIDLGTRDEFEQIFTQLASSKSSTSPTDKEDIVWFVAQYRDDVLRLLPPVAPHKENMAVVGAALLRFTSQGTEWLDSQIKTATDVLRLAAALSDGDVSLAAAAKFRSFTRRERRLLLGWIERSSNPTEDMLRWKERWKRLGERLHPGDFSDKFPRVYAGFRALREDLPVDTFASRVERSLAAGEVATAIENLRTRPGELARRLDHLMRISADPTVVIASFKQVAAQASSPLLLQVMTHFQHRDNLPPLRTFFPKGEVANAFAKRNNLPPIASENAAAIATICRETLLRKFAEKGPLGDCFVDPQLANFPVPLVQRSAAKALRTLPRGSRLPLPDSDVIRFFLWWKNGRSRTDIDLSAALFDGKYRYVDVVSYYNLKNFGGHHSGDIVDAPQGAAEFIDLSRSLCRAKGVRYIVASINSFTTQPFCDLPECFAGWMARKTPGSGEIFEPKSVHDKVDIAANTTICLPMVIDLEAEEMLWTDLALTQSPLWNNVRQNLTGVSLMLRAITSLQKPDLQTLFTLHAEARGQLVATPEEAETLFSVDEGITPFDAPKILSEFL
ncbi:TerD family protein [Blastopirellula marina]|uniref:Cytoplasmic protein n=1 Tax=Blastopirellula marina TaxID=124 RepID=A0A2S8FF95_9BACT|nr:TerD family protein [Blastopirellula marina]PQO30836.1 hypothetical protein C5Y98_20815 [Blastopirellula marina]PTL42689.1 hypothetical protein C5Y97_20825 [Blastopirellula marina]